MLPSDFDIFSSAVRIIPLCIQIRASGTPRAASVWAISFSWWGKIRSEPPLWISKSAPSSFSAIAEHSMCQPGRPSPQGEGQDVSSSGLRAFQSAKSSRSSLSWAVPGLLALVHLVRIAVGELAVAVEAPDAEVDVAAGLVGVAGLDQRLDQRDDLGDRLGRERLRVRPPEPEAVGVLDVEREHPPDVLGRRHAALARGVVDLVVDVGDVDHQRRLVALVGEEAAQQHRDHVGPRVADVDPRVDRRPAGVDAHAGRLARLERRRARR